MLSIQELEQSRKTAETVLKWMERLQGLHDLFVEAKAYLGEKQSLEHAIAAHKEELAHLHQEWVEIEALLLPLRAELAALPDELAQRRQAHWEQILVGLEAEAVESRADLKARNADVLVHVAELEALRDSLTAECADLQGQVAVFRSAMDAAREQAAVLIGG